MKRIISLLLFIVAAMIAFAQNSKNIRIYSPNDLYNHSIRVSEIDSITYDYDCQTQNVIVQGKIYPYPIIEIDSIAFNDRMNYTVVEDIVKNMDGILSEDGKTLLYGKDSTGNYVMQYGNFDFIHKKWDEESMFVIQLNNEFRPISFVTNDIAYGLSYNTDGSFDVLSFNNDGTYEVIANNLIISTNSLKRIAHSANENPSFGDVGSWVGNGLTIWNLIKEIRTGGLALSTGLNAIGSLIGIGSTTGGFLVGGAGDILAWLKNGAAGLYGGALTLSTYLYQKSQEFQLQHLGDWKVEILSVEQTSRKQCEVTYSIANINNNCEGNPCLLAVINDPAKRWSYVIKEIDLGTVQNGVWKKSINIDEAGEYTIELVLWDKCHPFISQRTYPATRFLMFDLGLDKYEVREDPVYSDGKVYFNLDIYLKGNGNSLTDVKQYGVYTKFANNVDYHKVDHLSSIFETTPFTLELPIEKEAFFDVNYNTFKATATDYSLGIYVVLKNGNIIMYDENDIEGLVYDEKPSLTFTSASLGGTDVYDDEEGTPYRCSTQINANYTATGTFWVNTVDLVVIQGSAQDNVDYWDVMNDGDFPFTVYYSYPYVGDQLSAFRFDFVLSNGNRVSSTNAVQVFGSPTVTNISIIGNEGLNNEGNKTKSKIKKTNTSFIPKYTLKKIEQ